MMLMEDMIHQSWFSEPCAIGIDEAGRGSVCGPMVYAVAACPISYHSDEVRRKAEGGSLYDDSKVLTPSQRDALFAKVKSDEHLAHAISSISAQEISSSMLATSRITLNELGAQATVQLIECCLSRRINVTVAYIDTVGDAQQYSKRLSNHFPGIDFMVCPKADSLYPIVSIASIVAKVTRDCAECLSNASMGSGYPADPACKQWLQDSVDPVFGFPDCVRFSWQTADRILHSQCYDVEFASDVDIQRDQLVLSDVGDQKRHSYFQSRHIRQAAMSDWQ